MDKTAWMGVLIPFIGTSAGSAMVFFMKKTMSAGLEKALLGFASGVMIAASVWSLLIPAMEMAEDMPVPTWLPARSPWPSVSLSRTFPRARSSPCP